MRTNNGEKIIFFAREVEEEIAYVIFLPFIDLSRSEKFPDKLPGKSNLLFFRKKLQTTDTSRQ
jgi:hypothetical protein